MIKMQFIYTKNFFSISVWLLVWEAPALHAAVGEVRGGHSAALPLSLLLAGISSTITDNVLVLTVKLKVLNILDVSLSIRGAVSRPALQAR